MTEFVRKLDQKWLLVSDLLFVLAFFVSTKVWISSIFFAIAIIFNILLICSKSKEQSKLTYILNTVFLVVLFVLCLVR